MTTKRNNLHLRLLSNAPRIVGVHVKAHIARRATKRSTATNRNFARIQVHWMRVEAVDGQAGLKVRIQTDVKSIQHAIATVFAEAIAAEQVDDVPAITVQWSYCELIAQQVQNSLGEIKE